MSGILAVLHRDGSPVEPASVERMLAAMSQRGADGVDHLLSGPAALARQHLWETPEDVDQCQPLVDEGSGVALVFDGRLDGRERLCEALSVAPTHSLSGPDARLVMEAYLRWGEAFAERLLGDFALAVWDPRRHEMILARDALGTRGLSYHLDDRRLLAASDVGALLRHPDLSSDIDERSVARYLASHWDDQESTFFASVRHLPPAHTLAVGGGPARRRRYWSLDPERRAPRASLAENAEALRALLFEATADRLRCRGPVGASLSGGLDSSSVAAVAAVAARRSGGAPLRAYTYAFERFAEYDERPWARLVTDHCGLLPVDVPCDELRPLADPASWPVERDFVLFDPFVLLPAAVRDAARADGCRLLLVGHHSDLLFWGGQYWLAEALRDGRLVAALSGLTLGGKAVRWRADVWERGLRPLVPGSWKAAWRRRRPRTRSQVAPLLSAGLAARTGLVEEIATARARAAIRRPAGLEREGDLVRGLGPHGAALARRFYERAGLVLADPYQDRRLVEFAMSMPADHLGAPGCRKRLLRYAMAPLLPGRVRARPRWPGLAPMLERTVFGERSRFIRGLFEPGLVRQMDLVDEDWLRAALTGSRPSAALAYQVWLCVSLELWLRRLLAGPGWPSPPPEAAAMAVDNASSDG